LTRRVQSNGVVVACRQCRVCGSNLGCVPKSGTPIDDLPAWDDGLRETYLKARSEELAGLVRQRKAEFNGWYQEYLASDRWKSLRGLVLRRDGYICQACLSAPASEVHHLVYNLGHEAAFELVAVCAGCHDRLHDRGGRT
jgi:5-methylcytosine-specific restriction endonuclease McrA